MPRSIQNFAGGRAGSLVAHARAEQVHKNVPHRGTGGTLLIDQHSERHWGLKRFHQLERPTMGIAQRMFPALFGGLVSFAPGAMAQDHTFRQPRIDDVRLDWCWSWQVKDCGKRVADLFCARRHYTDARDFRAEKAGGHTRFIGSGESCNDPGCVGFAYITCRGQVLSCAGGGAGANVCSEQNPQWKGYRLDRCREWGVNCGAPVAEAYCRSKGFRTYQYFRTDAQSPGVPTRLIGTDQICRGNFCRGFQIIACQK